MRVRSGIRQFTEIDEMTRNSQTMFEYNEEEIRHLLPKEISTAIQVRDHIIRNRMAIEEMAIDIGRKRAAIVKIETGKKARDSIRSLGIEECRRAVFEAQQTQPKVQR